MGDCHNLEATLHWRGCLKNGIFCTWKQDHFSFSPLKNFLSILWVLIHFSTNQKHQNHWLLLLHVMNQISMKSTTICVSPLSSSQASFFIQIEAAKNQKIIILINYPE